MNSNQKKEVNMIKLIFLGLILLLVSGCYSCREAMEMNYDSCKDERDDEDFCLKVAELEAQNDGYCSTSSINFNYNLGY